MRSWVLGATGYCDSLKQSQKWSFGDYDSTPSIRVPKKMMAAFPADHLET
jgi:hypothetical protein